MWDEQYSIGLYNCKADLDALYQELVTIIAKQLCCLSQHQRMDNDHFVHKTFILDPQAHFNIKHTFKSVFSPYFTDSGARI